MEPETKDNEKNIFKLLRLIRNLSVKELAEKLDISPSSVSLIESGKRNPGKRLLKDYAELLGVTPEFLRNHMSSDGKTKPEESFEKYLFYILDQVLSIDEKARVNGLI